jgi:hypothetical protein
MNLRSMGNMRGRQSRRAVARARRRKSGGCGRRSAQAAGGAERAGGGGRRTVDVHHADESSPSSCTTVGRLLTKVEKSLADSWMGRRGWFETFKQPLPINYYRNKILKIQTNGIFKIDYQYKPLLL